MKLAAILAILAVIVPASVSADTSTGIEPTLHQLVSEVQQLRVILQQYMSMQVSLDQIKHQRDVVSSLKQQIDLWSSESETLARQYSDCEETVRDLEARLALDPLGKDNSQLRNELTQARKALEFARYQVSKFKEKELANQTSLIREEARLNELSRSLEAQLGNK